VTVLQGELTRGTPLPFGEDEFWIVPAVINDVNRGMNETGLPTMALGADTLPRSASAISEEIGSLLIVEADQLSMPEGIGTDLVSELRRPIPIGFTYGKLLARESNKFGNVAASDVSQRVIRTRARELRVQMRDVTQGIDTISAAGMNEMFRRLRMIEMMKANSDVLAFGSLGVHLHMRDEYRRHHEGEALTREQVQLMQVLFYAGALAGGLLNIQTSRLKRPPNELMGLMMASSENIAS
jgi:hypothetical protein